MWNFYIIIYIFLYNIYLFLYYNIYLEKSKCKIFEWPREKLWRVAHPWSKSTGKNQRRIDSSRSFSKNEKVSFSLSYFS